MNKKLNTMGDIKSSFELPDTSALKKMNAIFDKPDFKNALESLKSVEYTKPLIDLDRYDFSGEKVNSYMKQIEESGRRKEQERQDFLNNTKIIAESNVALVNSNEQILKVNNQLLSCNEILVSQNQTLTNQLSGMNDKLNTLSEEIILSSKIQEILGTEHIDKLDEIIKLLNNPTDENLVCKISNSFSDIPPQVIIALVVEALKISFGIGA